MDFSSTPNLPAPAPPVRPASLFRRLSQRFMRLDAHDIAKIKVEDMALAGGYFLLFGLLDQVNLNGVGVLQLSPFESAWPAIAVLGCLGVLFRRCAPHAMAWMCGAAVVGLLLAGHSGAFILAFELFFSLVLFGTARASRIATRIAWVLTVGAVVAAFAATRSGALSVTIGILAVVTLLTPAEWAGNLRKAQQLVNSEHARANAVEEAGHQRLLAERSAHELALDRERQHMARELHDVISARLSAIALQSGAALHTAQEGPGTMLLRQIRSESVSGLDELNTMIRLLHAGASSPAPGRIAELPALTDAHRAAGGDVHFSNSLDDGGHHLPLPVQTAVYRIAAEALTNAAKHAPGQPVSLSLAAVHADTTAELPASMPGNHGQDLLLEVSNSLPTSAAGIPNGTGTGLPSMHFRAAHAGGTLTAAPDGPAWKVVLRLPLANEMAPAKNKISEASMELCEGPTA